MVERELPWKDAINAVMQEADEPLHYEAITQAIIAAGLRTSLGATPASTVNANISNSIKHEGESSPYVRVEKGVYALRTTTGMQQNEKQAKKLEEDEAQYTLITSFGMFWRRNGVDWKASPRLLGMQNIGATTVDFCQQLGIYLLYDGREVIYVGRSTDRPLGRRLYEHTFDRLATRWDRFSWFGLLPVFESGDLGQMPDHHATSLIIPALEAVLIEAVEPRQNRKRGDDLAAVEFIQTVDPEISKRQMKATFDTLLEKF